ncbi:Cupredoxin [Scleroderma yunnanense]
MPATELTAGGALGGPHFVHLHGHVFDVVRVVGRSAYNYVDPVKRDTVTLNLQANGDNVTFRFITNNLGPWYFHWHNDWHVPPPQMMTRSGHVSCLAACFNL